MGRCAILIVGFASLTVTCGLFISVPPLLNRMIGWFHLHPDLARFVPVLAMLVHGLVAIMLYRRSRAVSLRPAVTTRSAHPATARRR